MRWLLLVVCALDYSLAQSDEADSKETTTRPPPPPIGPFAPGGDPLAFTAKPLEVIQQTFNPITPSIPQQFLQTKASNQQSATTRSFSFLDTKGINGKTTNFKLTVQHPSQNSTAPRVFHANPVTGQAVGSDRANSSSAKQTFADNPNTTADDRQNNAVHISGIPGEIALVGNRPVVLSNQHQSRQLEREETPVPAVHPLSELRPSSRVSKQQQGIFFVPPVTGDPGSLSNSDIDFINAIRPSAGPSGAANVPLLPLSRSDEPVDARLAVVHNVITPVRHEVAEPGRGSRSSALFQDVHTGQVGQQQNSMFIHGVTGEDATGQLSAKIPDPDERMSRIEADLHAGKRTLAQGVRDPSFVRPTPPPPVAATNPSEDFDAVFKRQKEELERKFSAKEFDPSSLSVTEFPNAQGAVSQQPPEQTVTTQRTPPRRPDGQSTGPKIDVFKNPSSDSGRTRTIDFTIERTHHSGGVTTQTFKQIVPVLRNEPANDSSALSASSPPPPSPPPAPKRRPLPPPPPPAPLPPPPPQRRQPPPAPAPLPTPASQKRQPQDGVTGRQDFRNEVPEPVQMRLLSPRPPTDRQIFLEGPRMPVLLAPVQPLLLSSPRNDEEARRYRQEQRQFEQDQRRYREQQRKFAEDRRRFEESRRRFEEDQRRFEEQRRAYEQDKLRFENDRRNLQKQQEQEQQAAVQPPFSEPIFEPVTAPVSEVPESDQRRPPPPRVPIAEVDPRPQQVFEVDPVREQVEPAVRQPGGQRPKTQQRLEQPQEPLLPTRLSEPQTKQRTHVPTESRHFTIDHAAAKNRVPPKQVQVVDVQMQLPPPAGGNRQHPKQALGAGFGPTVISASDDPFFPVALPQPQDTPARTPAHAPVPPPRNSQIGARRGTTQARKSLTFSLGTVYFEDNQDGSPGPISNQRILARNRNLTSPLAERRGESGPQGEPRSTKTKAQNSRQPEPVAIVPEIAHRNEANNGGGDLPGTPGVDYPNYAVVPDTPFSCKAQESAGMYADIDTGCQAFHNCDPLGHKMSFLCPNGTVFKQELFICDWWYNVHCPDSEKFFHLNTNKYTTPRPRRRRRRGDKKKKAASA